MGQKVDAYDKKTGRKLPYRVPEKWFSLFKNISKTPIQKAREATKKASVATNKKEG